MLQTNAEYLETMVERTIEIAECDEAGNVKATFVESANQDGTNRIDVVVR
jgi:hypothetical protein